MAEKQTQPSQEAQPTKHYDEGRSISDKAKELYRKLRGPNEVYPTPSPTQKQSADVMADKRSQDREAKKEGY